MRLIITPSHWWRGKYDFSCIDDDTYDGPGSLVGIGSTAQEALADWIEQDDQRKANKTEPVS